MHTVIQAPTFLADCDDAGLSEDEIADIVSQIATDPLRGDIIKGTGGARKRRFPGRGRGKSGGYRTVAYFAGEDVPVALLALIDKGARANISDADANALRKELAGYAEDYRRGVQRRVQELKRKKP